MISIGGTINPIEELVNVLQVTYDARANKILLFVKREETDSRCLNGLFVTLQVILYNSPEDTVFMALGIEQGCEEVFMAEMQHRDPELLVLHPHIFRHTYATRCVEYGLSPNAIQKLLGHATLDMLNVYAHPSTEFLKEECKKYNFYYEKDRNDTNEKVIPIDFRKNSV